MNWFKKKKFKPKPPWFEKYLSSCMLSEEDKVFLSYYTEQGFNSILGWEEYFINSRYKIYLNEYVLAVRHYVETGEKKYFYTHRQGQQELKKQNEALRSLINDFIKERQHATEK